MRKRYEYSSWWVPPLTLYGCVQERMWRDESGVTVRGVSCAVRAFSVEYSSSTPPPSAVRSKAYFA